MEIINDNKTKWNSLLDDNFHDYADVFFRYQYFQLFDKHFQTRPEALVWDDDKLAIFWTHLIRTIRTSLNSSPREGLYDLTTPYGYGGPLVVAKTDDGDVQNSLRIFFEDYNTYAADNNYVSEFVRFHPFYEAHRFLEARFPIAAFGRVIFVKLVQDLSEIWANIRKGHRSEIKKSLRAGCQTRITDTPSTQDITTFTELYHKNMRFRQAQRKYYFTKEFLADHFKLLNSVLITTEFKDETVGASIYLCGDDIMHYHLAAINYDVKGVYPNKLMLWGAIKWAKDHNFKHLHLGGGGTSDSLDEFKRGFSKDMATFYVGKNIFDQEKYQLLLDRMPHPSNSDFFPAYRSGISDTIV